MGAAGWVSDIFRGMGCLCVFGHLDPLMPDDVREEVKGRICKRAGEGIS